MDVCSGLGYAKTKATMDLDPFELSWKPSIHRLETSEIAKLVQLPSSHSCMSLSSDNLKSQKRLEFETDAPQPKPHQATPSKPKWPACTIVDFLPGRQQVCDTLRLRHLRTPPQLSTSEPKKEKKNNARIT